MPSTLIDFAVTTRLTWSPAGALPVPGRKNSNTVLRRRLCWLRYRLRECLRRDAGEERRVSPVGTLADAEDLDHGGVEDNVGPEPTVVDTGVLFHVEGELGVETDALVAQDRREAIRSRRLRECSRRPRR